MALTEKQLSVVASFVETSGRSVTREYVGDPATITNVTELSVAWALELANIKAMSKSVMGSYFYKVLFLEDALVLPADAINADEALFTAKLVGKPNKSGDLSIPAPVDTLFVSPTGKGFNVIDTGDALVSNYLDMFAAGGGWVFSDGDQLVKPTASGKRRNVKRSTG